eukprot:GAHX01000949.1.p1 GENE.GAHX01000949.1~~GAHX01000949.1.p1  ORF type:complete len:461 (-),score=108.72 GAHX01000949.1:12-1394(-)
MDYNLEAIRILSARPISQRLVNLSDKEETKFEITKYSDIYAQLEKEELTIINNESKRNLEVFNKLENFQLSSSYIIMRLENYHKNLVDIKHQYLDHIIHNTKLLNRTKNIKLEITLIKHLMHLENCYQKIEILISQQQYLESIKEINSVLTQRNENYKRIKSIENVYGKITHLKDKILYNIKSEIENKPLIYFLNEQFFNNLNTVFKVLETGNHTNVFKFILNTFSFSVESLIYYYYKEVNKDSKHILGLNKLNFHKKIKEKLLLDENGYIQIVIFILFLQNVLFSIIKHLFILFKSKCKENNEEINKQLNNIVAKFQTELYNVLKIFLNGYRTKYKEKAIYFKLFCFVGALNRKTLNKDTNLKLEQTIEYYFKSNNKNIKPHSLTIDLLVSDIAKCDELINEEKDINLLNNKMKEELFWYNFVDKMKRKLIEGNNEQKMFSKNVFMKKLFDIINVFFEY